MRLKSKDTRLARHPVARHARRTAERIWKENGRLEGVTVTAGSDGIHSAGSWHHCDAAEDFRTIYTPERTCWDGSNQVRYTADSRNWDEAERWAVYLELKDALPDYDVVWHDTHIHCEPGDDLARKWGLLI